MNSDMSLKHDAGVKGTSLARMQRHQIKITLNMLASHCRWTHALLLQELMNPMTVVLIIIIIIKL